MQNKVAGTTGAAAVWLCLLPVMLLCTQPAIGEQPAAGSVHPDTDLSFIREPFISPKIIADMLGWFSDRGEQVMAVNLLSANDSNRYACDIQVDEEPDRHPFIWMQEEHDRVGYRYIGRSEDGVHVLHTVTSGGGSGSFHTLLFIRFINEPGITGEQGQIDIRDRLIMKSHGTISLGDRYQGEISIKGSTLRIGKDTGWFSGRGEDWTLFPSNTAVELDM